jgi:hypothetical protein
MSMMLKLKRPDSTRALILVASTCVVLLSALGCSRKYRASGRSGPLDVSGDYETEELVYESTCDASAGKPSEVSVQQSPGAAEFRLIYRGLVFDGVLRDNGSFRTNEVRRRYDNSTETTSIVGSFKAATLSANLHFKRTLDPSATRARLTNACEYRLQLNGTRAE